MWSIRISFRGPPTDANVQDVVAALHGLNIAVQEKGRGSDWVRWETEEIVETPGMWGQFVINLEDIVDGYQVIRL